MMPNNKHTSPTDQIITTNATISSTSHVARLETSFLFFDQVRALQPNINKTDAAFLTLREKAKQLQTQLQKLGKTVAEQLIPLRADLICTMQPLPVHRLPHRLGFSLSRQQHSPQTDALIYLFLREEGLEIGFGFGVRETQAREPIKEQFLRNIHRFHRKLSKYVNSLLQKDYRLWEVPCQQFQKPSETLEQWSQKSGAVVRLIERNMLLPLQGNITGIISQICSELIGFYGFLDRVNTTLPILRPLHLESPEDIEDIPAESDIHTQQSIGRECILDFLTYTRHRRFFFPAALARSYMLSLQTRPIVILSGTAGTGKSKLAAIFAQFITQDAERPEGNPHFAYIPVRPDWLDPQALLGYFDTLSYSYRPTPFLQLLLRAKNDPQNPYFVLLDEMNLARIEYYFSEILSVIESRQFNNQGEIIEQAYIHCHMEPEPLQVADPFMGYLPLPQQLELPPNVYITGTVNIDETTHRMSPKVLDRINLIEVPSVSPALYLEWFCQPPTEEHTRTPTQIAEQRTVFMRHGKFTASYHSAQLTITPERIASLAAVLDCIYQILQKAGFTFGLRLTQEVLDFAENSERLYSPLEAPESWVLDCQMTQKILPKLHGSRRILEPVLGRLLQLCWTEREQPAFRKALLKNKVELHALEDIRQAALGKKSTREPPDLPTSARKIASMLTALQHVSYIDFFVEK